MTYELKKNQENILEDSFGTNSRESEKRQKGVYLTEEQWSELDKRADEMGISRNKYLRNLLRTVLEDEG